MAYLKTWRAFCYNRSVSEEDTGAHVPPENKGDKPGKYKRSRIPRRDWENPSIILLQFRDGHATDMETLLEALGVYEDPRMRALLEIGDRQAVFHNSLTMRIPSNVRLLIYAGLLQADDPEDHELERTKIGVTPLLQKIQTGLDLSLTSLAKVNRYGSMIVEPFFGKPGALIEKLDVFVLMPFKADMLPVYEDHIKPTCASMELAVRRADDFFTASRAVEDIWKAIVSARLIVADCTDRNPNVFYEIGPCSHDRKANHIAHSA
jgi:hypothetical protein